MNNAERIEAYYRKTRLLKQMNAHDFTQRYRRGLKVKAVLKYLAGHKRNQS